MWAVLVKRTPDGEVSLGVVLLEDGVLKLDLPADEARAEIEPLFEVGDITHAWGGYSGQVEPLQYKRMTDRWFVAVLNSFSRAVWLARDPPTWRLTRRGLNQMPQRTQEPAPHGEPAV